MTLKSPLIWLSFLILALAAEAQDIQPRIHEPREIMGILDKSKQTYVVDDLTGTDSLPSPRPPLPLPPPFVDTSGGDRKLSQYEVKDSIRQQLDRAVHDLAKDPAALRKVYYDTYRAIPGYSYLLTLIADTYCRQHLYDSAVAVFKQSIDSNFIDFQAHWWLGESYWKLGHTDEAIAELTIANVIDPNDTSILTSLRVHRQEIGRPWHGYTYEPIYKLRRDDTGVVRIQCRPEWLGYAVVKAVWAYEPGYAEEMLQGQPYHSELDLMEEKEALLGAVSTNQQLGWAIDAIKAGFASELILYHLATQRVPELVLIQNKEIIQRVAQYVDKFM